MSPSRSHSDSRIKEVATSSIRGRYRKRLRKEAKPPVSVTHPEVVEQWHPSKNKDLSPHEITYGSHKKVWWLCPVHPSHEWQTPCHGRCTKDGQMRSGCPYCSSHKVCVTNSLATLYPVIAEEWHPQLNKSLTPNDVTSKSQRMVWWQCKNDEEHVWSTLVGWRTGDDTGCPFCSNKKISKTNSLAVLYPDTAREWHPKKNGKLTAWDVVPGSHKDVWWRCRLDPKHEWQTTLRARIVDKTGCPFCIGRRPTDTLSLAACFPEIANEWHPVKNGLLTPWSIVPGANKKVWWRCSKNSSHEWQTKVVSRTRAGTGCPSCVKRHRTVPTKSNNLARLYPEIAAQWHPTKNGKLRPAELTPGSNKAIWWKCSEGADHLWRTKVVSRTKAHTGCPFCAGKKPSKKNNLAVKYPDLASQWHPSRNGSLTPKDVTSRTNMKVWWQCRINKRHVWESAINKRTSRNQQCPKCNKKSNK